MLKRIILLLCFSYGVKAEMKLFLDFTINDSKSLIQLDEALKVGLELKKAIKALRTKGENSDQLSILEKQLSLYEQKLQDTYGLYPGLTYKMAATSGYIFNLIPVSKKDEYIEKGHPVPSDCPKVIIKDSNKNDIECFKVKVRLLQRRESVIQFNQALRTSFSIKKQIEDLNIQLKNKPELKAKPEIQKGMEDLRGTLAKIEKKMEEEFAVKKDGKYIFEPKTGAVYLALNKDDLEKLSNLNKARDK